MIFVRFTMKGSGLEVWINPKRIVLIEEMQEGGCVISASFSPPVLVSETIEHVIRAIARAINPVVEV